jgi:chorismate mutase/prephenate dehydratase
MSCDDQALRQVRARIDELDAAIQQLIVERAQCAHRIAELKQSAPGTLFYRPEREAQVLRSVMARDVGLLSAPNMAHIFREIMSACLAVEQPLQVAFFGPSGTFTHEAALKHFGHAVAVVPQVTIADVFRAVATQRCDYGVVPVENSTEGSVNQTLDALRSSPLNICGEVVLRVHLQLLSLAEERVQVRRIYGHQQALAQCRAWLDTHMAGVEQVAATSNGEAARLAAEEPSSAAVASVAAGEIYGLKTLASNIEDEPDNTTRFLVVGQQTPGPSGRDKTSLLLMTGNQPGALFRALSPFAQHGISMTRIESRPSRRGAWDYVFFVDLEGHVQDEKIASAIRELESQITQVKVLGAYPRAVL